RAVGDYTDTSNAGESTMTTPFDSAAMTKSKCRELYEQMATAITEFEDALADLCKLTRSGPDENGKWIIEYHGRIRDIDHFCLPDFGLPLHDAAEALEQIMED